MILKRWMNRHIQEADNQSEQGEDGKLWLGSQDRVIHLDQREDAQSHGQRLGHELPCTACRTVGRRHYGQIPIS